MDDDKAIQVLKESGILNPNATLNDVLDACQRMSLATAAKREALRRSGAAGSEEEAELKATWIVKDHWVYTFDDSPPA